MSRSSRGNRFEGLREAATQPVQSFVARGWPWLVAFVLVVWTLAQSFVLVGAGERAVVFNRLSGTEHHQLAEGLHLVMPWVQSTAIYDVRTHAYTMSAARSEANQQAGYSNDALTALTADGLPVALDLSVLFHVDPDQAWRLHQVVGPEYLEKIVRPVARAQVRMVVARFPVVAVYGARRAQIIQEVNARLKQRFAENYLVLDEALLRDVRFSPEFQQAIEQKQVAQQDVQRMKFVLEQADKERRRKIIEAEGDAESIRLKAAALARNPQLVEYEYVKSLPTDVRAVITDGRTIVNLGDAASPAAAAAATGKDR
jgi:regulator of protease activity HflC (stomatin/prohibitin superfamily)